jgi:hypothetical protein
VIIAAPVTKSTSIFQIETTDVNIIRSFHDQNFPCTQFLCKLYQLNCLRN